MNRIMFLLSFCILFAFVSCEDKSSNESFEATGTYVGLDEALCACCGNYKIDIDGVEKEHQFLALPEGIELDLDNPPIDVKFNWTLINDCSGINHITIDDLEVE